MALKPVFLAAALQKRLYLSTLGILRLVPLLGGHRASHKPNSVGLGHWHLDARKDNCHWVEALGTPPPKLECQRCSLLQVLLPL